MKKFILMIFASFLFVACQTSNSTSETKPANADTILDEKAEEENDKFIEEKLDSIRDSNLEIEAKALSKNNYSICDQIEDDQTASNCKFNVIANQGTVELCSKIDNDKIEQKCIESFSDQ